MSTAHTAGGISLNTKGVVDIEAGLLDALLDSADWLVEALELPRAG